MGHAEIMIAKSFTATLNIFILICGCIILTVGILNTSDIDSYSFLVYEDYDALLWTPAIIIAISSVIILFSIFGYVSAIPNNRNLILVVMVSLCFLILAQIAVSAFFLWMLKDEDRIELKMEQILEKTFSSKDARMKRRTDYIQQKLQCCGLQNKNPFGSKPPSSCDSPITERRFTETCEKQFASKLIHTPKRLSYLMLALVVVEIVGVAITSCWYVAFHNEEDCII